MKSGVVLLEFCADEGEEVVSIEKRLGAFCEVLFVIGQAVVSDAFASIQEDVGVQVFSFCFFERGNDSWFVE